MLQRCLGSLRGAGRTPLPPPPPTLAHSPCLYSLCLLGAPAGARADSYYEYLLKQWLLTGRTEDWLRERYVQAMQSVRERLLRRTAPEGGPGLRYVKEEDTRGRDPNSKMDHLICFLPGERAQRACRGLSAQRGRPARAV